MEVDRRVGYRLDAPQLSPFIVFNPDNTWLAFYVLVKSEKQKGSAAH